MRQWIIANIISGFFTFVAPISYTEQAILLAAGILILAAECMNTAIERVVDDISHEVRSAAHLGPPLVALAALPLAALLYMYNEADPPFFGVSNGHQHRQFHDSWGGASEIS